ncbi:hypothetical protein ACA910_016634 [Epithemia clementina (nom. ined.)]
MESLSRRASATTGKRSKRKRARSDGDSATAAPAIDNNVPGRLAIFKGKRFAVSTRVHRNDDADADENNDKTTKDLSFSHLRELCISFGAEYSAQVHKKVDAVVASSEAVETPATQRVRKAWKLGIPVVHMEWIHECKRRKQIVPMDLYYFPKKEVQVKNLDRKLRPPPSSSSLEFSRTTKEPRKSKRRKADSGSDINGEKSTKDTEIDLGCCCICHDSAHQGAVTDCQWCTDCTVNRKNQS